MIDCLYKHLLNPKLHNADVAKFLDALHQPEIDSASNSELIYFVDHMPPLDDIITHLEQLEDSLIDRRAMPLNFFVAHTPQDIIRYDFKLNRRQHTPTDVLTNCKALTFASKSYFTFLVCYVEMLEQIHVFCNSINGHTILSTIDIHRETQSTERIMYRTAQRVPNQYCSYTISNIHEMRAILQKIQTINHITDVNMNQLQEHELLRHLATTLKAITAF